MRVYLPATIAGLSTRLAGRSSRPAGAGALRQIEPLAGVADAGDIAFGVTAALREWYREGDLEELEYVALTRAAHASLRLLAAEGDAEGVARAGLAGEGIAGAARRVVVAADVPDAALLPAPDVDVAAVRLRAPVPFSALAALHADDVSIADEVSGAAAVVEAAIGGDLDAGFVVDGLDDHELQWYAVQEIAYLLDDGLDH